MARAGPPEWMGIGGRVYVEELLCVLARVPITVDMLRETVRWALVFERLGGECDVFAVCCLCQFVSNEVAQCHGGVVATTAACTVL